LPKIWIIDAGLLGLPLAIGLKVIPPLASVVLSVKIASTPLLTRMTQSFESVLVIVLPLKSSVMFDATVNCCLTAV